jgi:hypothetical protein
MRYPSRVRRVARSAGAGALLALLVALLVFILGSQTAAVTAYLAPGIVLGGLVSPVLPSALAYSVNPEGGPEAFLLISLASAFFFWGTLLGGIHYFWRRAKHPRRRDSSR